MGSSHAASRSELDREVRPGADAAGKAPVVVVVGAGITGLAAAWELCSARDPRPRVVVLESAARPGGRILTEDLHGVPVDFGADSFVARMPEGRQLCIELDLEQELTSPAATGAMVWSRGRLRRIPPGLLLGVPGRLRPLARSGILSPLAVVRAGLEPLLPGGREDADMSVADLVSRRFGKEVDAALADPIIGGINAGSTRALSLAASAPALDAASRTNRSLLLALSAQLREGAVGENGSSPAQFLSLRSGMGRLVAQLSERLVRAGVEVRLSEPVERIERAGTARPRRWLVTSTTAQVEADAVVVTTPAPVAARQLAATVPETASDLSAIDYASVALVTVVFPEGSLRVPPDVSGFLVPRSAGSLITACTWTSSKWPHMKPPGKVLVRASTGRDGDDRALQMGDEALVERIRDELRRFTGTTGRPLEARVSRWVGAFPQYRVGHLDLVGRVEAAEASAPGLAIAGAALRGLGIPACISQGRRAATRVLAGLGGRARR